MNQLRASQQATQRYRVWYKFGPDEETDSLERADFLIKLWAGHVLRVWDQVEDRDVAPERRIAIELMR